MRYEILTKLSSLSETTRHTTRLFAVRKAETCDGRGFSRRASWTASRHEGIGLGKVVYLAAYYPIGGSVGALPVLRSLSSFLVCWLGRPC